MPKLQWRWTEVEGYYLLGFLDISSVFIPHPFCFRRHKGLFLSIYNVNILNWFFQDSWLGVLHHIAGECGRWWVRTWDSLCGRGKDIFRQKLQGLWSNSQGGAWPEVFKKFSQICHISVGSNHDKNMRVLHMYSLFINYLLISINHRHTSKVENFNSMLLKYAPKRVGFQ